VAYLDSDDYWYPHHLSRAVAALAGHEEAIGVYSIIAQVWDNEKEPFEVNRQSGPVDRRTALSGGNRPFITTLVARRQAVEAAGGFDPRFDGAEDKDFIYRLLEKGPCLRLDDVTVAYRTHGSNVSADPVRSFKVDARVLAAHRARALAAGDNQAAADIAVGLRALRQYTAGVCVSGRWRRRSPMSSHGRHILPFGHCGVPLQGRAHGRQRDLEGGTLSSRGR